MDMTTQDKIICAAINLVREHGYKGATTKRIAEKAGVNEVTLFRHFGNKKGIVEAIIDKYSFTSITSDTFNREVKWDLEKDLHLLATLYQDQVKQKRDIILIGFKEAGVFPELDELIAKVPSQYIEMITSYFHEMIRLEKMRPVDPHVAATNFFFINFGYFLLNRRVRPDGQEMPRDKFLKENIAFFTESLKLQ